jgi:hypothetical protein
MPRNPLRYLPFADKWTPTDTAGHTRRRRPNASKVTVIPLAERTCTGESETRETAEIGEVVPLRARNLRADVLQVFRDAQAGRT